MIDFSFQWRGERPKLACLISIIIAWWFKIPIKIITRAARSWMRKLSQKLCRLFLTTKPRFSEDRSYFFFLTFFNRTGMVLSAASSLAREALMNWWIVHSELQNCSERTWQMCCDIVSLLVLTVRRYICGAREMFVNFAVGLHTHLGINLVLRVPVSWAPAAGDSRSEWSSCEWSRHKQSFQSSGRPLRVAKIRNRSAWSLTGSGP